MQVFIFYLKDGSSFTGTWAEFWRKGYKMSDIRDKTFEFDEEEEQNYLEIRFYNSFRHTL